MQLAYMHPLGWIATAIIAVFVVRGLIPKRCRWCAHHLPGDSHGPYCPKCEAVCTQ